jgi:hypothetical protein
MWIAIAALGGAVVALWLALRREQARLARAELRIASLDAQVRTEVAGELSAARAEARSAASLARRAAGLDDPPPRVALEPVTGRLIKAVAMGAGARRALGRLAGRDALRHTARARKVVQAERRAS